MLKTHAATPRASWKGNTTMIDNDGGFAVACVMSSLRGWKDAVAGTCPADAPGHIRQNPVLWDLYLYGYTAAKEALS